MTKPTLRHESSFIDYDSSGSDVVSQFDQFCRILGLIFVLWHCRKMKMRTLTRMMKTTTLIHGMILERTTRNHLPSRNPRRKVKFLKWCLLKVVIHSCSCTDDAEQAKPNSLSWMAMRLAATRLCMVHIEEFLRVAGVEPQGTYNLWLNWRNRYIVQPQKRFAILVLFRPTCHQPIEPCYSAFPPAMVYLVAEATGFGRSCTCRFYSWLYGGEHHHRSTNSEISKPVGSE